RADRGLTKREAAIIGRHLGVREHFKTAKLQRSHSVSQQGEILEHATAETDSLHAEFRSNLFASRIYYDGKCFVESGGDRGGIEPCTHIVHDFTDHFARIDVSAGFDREAIRIARPFATRFEQHCRFAFVTVALANTGKGRDSVEKSATTRAENRG